MAMHIEYIQPGHFGEIMTNDELRVAALSQASSDQKHKDHGVGGGMSFSGTGLPPDADSVVARAEVYLKFLMGERTPKKTKK